MHLPGGGGGTFEGRHGAPPPDQATTLQFTQPTWAVQRNRSCKHLRGGRLLLLHLALMVKRELWVHCGLAAFSTISSGTQLAEQRKASSTASETS